MTNVLDRFVSDPIVSGSTRWPLSAPVGVAPAMDVPSAVRPFGLRRLVHASDAVRVAVRGLYDPVRQVSVDVNGRELVCGDPTANTTSIVDGEDGPSSEDWNNDFHIDEPCSP